jgi:N-acetylglucosamine-6-phosphate deacetylase
MNTGDRIAAIEAQVVKGIHYKTGDFISVHIQDGDIKDIVREVSTVDGELNHGQVRGRQNPALKIESRPGSRTVWPIIAPGLVDLQINGYRGMDYNTLPIEEEMAEKITDAIYAEGVTSYFPTVITNSDEAIEAAVKSIVRGSGRRPLIRDAIAGIHLEGPFLSPKDGARGAHDKRYVKAPDWDWFQRWQEAAEGSIKLLTLSPEWPGACHFIEKCADSGVTVSIGHTAAEPEQIREAVKAGARMSTHFGNGAELMLPRHPNYLWEQLAEDDLWTCLIADGFHLPLSVLKVAMKVKGEKALLVSDAVYLSGLQPGSYRTHIGGNVILTPEGKLHLAENPKLLAGSAQMLPWGIAHLINSGLAELPQAWDMASTKPAALMSLPSANGLKKGAPADLVLFNIKEKDLEIVATYKSGKRVYRR